MSHHLLTVYFKNGEEFVRTAGEREELEPILALCKRYEQPYTLNALTSAEDATSRVAELLEPDNAQQRGVA